MILCFSGTGNSKFVADALSEKISDKVISINDILKKNRKREFKSEKPFVIVAPVYAWQLPQIINEFIESSSFEGSDKIYFVATMGKDTGNTDKYCKKLCSKIGMIFMGFTGITMPDNYVFAVKMKSKEECEEILRNSLPAIEDTAEKILALEKIKLTDRSILRGLKSGMVNKMFNQYARNDNGFTVSDKCTLCSACVKLCPLNNIKIKNDKITFMHNCTNCYSCIHHCPTQALNIQGHTENNGRYVCPDYKTFEK